MPNDIFVSYARVDNDPLPGANQGWVTTLIKGVKILLAKKLGGHDKYTLWMDNELRGHQQRTPETIKQLENSALLLLVLSPGYLASQWCRTELIAFLTQVGENSGRVFVVECDEVKRPNELKDLLGYKFFVKDDAGKPRTLATPEPDPKENLYYQKLDDLARELTDKIKSLRKQPKREPAVSTPELVPVGDIPPTTIFLAQVSDDLAQRRDEVKRYLEQRGVRVLPEQVYSMADTEIQQRIDQDLSQCCWFVQLLSQKIDQGLPKFQYKRAQAANLPILQWRDKRLNLNDVRDSKHKALLSQSTVIATILEEFKPLIINQLKPKKALKTKQTQGDDLVFINAAPEEMDLAHKIEKFLVNQYRIGCCLPLEDKNAKSAQVQKVLDQNLKYCNAVMVLYDNSPIDWVHEQVLFCQHRRDELDKPPFKIIAVYNTPSTDNTDKLPLPVSLPNLKVLECPTPQEKTCLPEFIRILRDE